MAQSSTSVAAPPVRALRDDGTLDPAHAEALTGELAVALYEHMVLSRALDERLVALQREGQVTQHAAAIGEEATIVAAAAAMRDEDWLFPSSREHAAALWRGTPLAVLAHHAFGTARDPGKGRDAPGPAFWKPARVASVSPLVGTQVPHAVGVAWAARIRKEDAAALVFVGEGATSSGDFHTGLNFAGVFRAPVVIVVRNNGWATSTPAARQTASASFAVKALAYGIRGVRVDGADAVAVLSVVREARARASAGQGATLVEALLPGEGGGADPLARMRRLLDARSLWSDERDARLREEVNADITRAFDEARATPAPAPSTLHDDVYADRLPES